MKLFGKKKKTKSAIEGEGNDPGRVAEAIMTATGDSELAKKAMQKLSKEQEEQLADENMDNPDTEEVSLDDLQEEILQEDLPQGISEGHLVNSEEPLDPEIERLITDPTVIGYGSREEQMAVYSAVLPMGYIPQTDTILDVGCGVGDLFAYLQEIRMVQDPKYTGIDYNANMINLAKIKFPEIENNFSNTDLFDLTPNQKFDWIVAMSAFNIKMHDDMVAYSLSAIDKMLEHANKGIGINFISEEVDDTDPEGDFIKYEPADIMRAVVEKYPNHMVIFMNNYIEGDFSIHIYIKE